MTLGVTWKTASYFNDSLLPKALLLWRIKLKKWEIG
jgi:hypothetical protein